MLWNTDRDISIQLEPSNVGMHVSPIATFEHHAYVLEANSLLTGMSNSHLNI